MPATGPAPLRWLAWIGAASVIAYTIGAPLWASVYPMMTDFPFHVASSSVFRHYDDPTWHFREQFELQPFAVPYLSLYLLSAAFMAVLPAVAATKVATGFLLALLPVGLMVLCWGMRKSPFLGLWGLVPAWGVLAHWGFINFLGATGLFAMSLGLMLRVVDKPSVRAQAALSACLVLLFFTHVFRFPMVLAAMLLVAFAMVDRADGVKGLIVPGAVALGLFMFWWVGRADAIPIDVRWTWPPDVSRVLEAPDYFADILSGQDDARLFRRFAWLFALTASVLFAFAVPRIRRLTGDSWVPAVHAIVAIVIVGAVALYLTLPMEIGPWWYVYPRELTVAVFLLPALLPDLPKRAWAELGFVVWTAWALAPLGGFVAEAHRDFSASTAHFREILGELPHAPKLLYLVYDHHGSRARHTPYVHLPAYAQAEHGGWLSFHFADFGHSPLKYRSRRDPAAIVPPEVPARWEWSPQLFELDRHGSFFDWFLIRRESSPDSLFEADPSIRRLAHFEHWWLYRRSPTGPPSQTP